MSAPIIELFRIHIGDGMGGSCDEYYLVSRHTDPDIAKHELNRCLEEAKGDSWVDFCLKAPIE